MSRPECLKHHVLHIHEDYYMDIYTDEIFKATLTDTSIIPKKGSVYKYTPIVPYKLIRLEETSYGPITVNTLGECAIWSDNLAVRQPVSDIVELLCRNKLLAIVKTNKGDMAYIDQSRHSEIVLQAIPNTNKVKITRIPAQCLHNEICSEPDFINREELLALQLSCVGVVDDITLEGGIIDEHL